MHFFFLMFPRGDARRSKGGGHRHRRVCGPNAGERERMLPWARAHLNPTGQALVVCTVAGMAYFVAADKAILSLARRHSYESAPDHLKDTSFAGAAAAAAARPRPPAFFRP
uniref:Uncharacterized protein n=1 Tax=Aegilops tauschii subsp. strangulata TaxID=200361 RepID=A0A453QMU9_AEGTS